MVYVCKYLPLFRYKSKDLYLLNLLLILIAKLFIFVSIFFCSGFAYAQDKYYLSFADTRFAPEIFGKNFIPDTIFPNRELGIKYLDELLVAAYTKGYLTATYSIMDINLHRSEVSLQTGKIIKWVTLITDSIEPAYLAAVQFKPKDFKNMAYSQVEVSELIGKLIRYAEQNGYPFTTVYFTDFSLQDTLIQATLRVNKGRIIRFKVPEIRGDLNLNSNYLSQYSGIKEGGLYNEKLIDELDAALRELPFCSVMKPSQVEFSGEDAQVVSFLDNRNASKFDLVIGVLPNNEITGRLLITGDGNLRLYNVFNAGELFDLHFTQLESATKELQTAFMYPYLPSLPLGVDLGFSLFLRDSTFLERNALVGVLFRFRGNNYVKAFTTFYNSDVLNVDTAYVLATHNLPENVDVSTTSYGVGMHYEKLNYIYNPRSGFLIDAEGAAGIKEIKQNSTILELTDPAYPEYDFASIYDSVELQTLAINYRFNAQYYIPVFRQSTIKTAFTGAALINNKIFNNELFRIGGNKLLRGFDEQSITASAYYIFTVEYRYLLSTNSFMQLFTDIGYTLNKSVTPYTQDFPIGFGAGISFETRAGIFGLSYALGRTETNPVQFKNAKIHFGYLNYF